MKAHEQIGGIPFMSPTYAVQIKAAERQLQLAFDTNDAALMQDALRRIEQLMRAYHWRTAPSGPIA
jgi:hypothetical protein